MLHAQRDFLPHRLLPADSRRQICPWFSSLHVDSILASRYGKSVRHLTELLEIEISDLMLLVIGVVCLTVAILLRVYKDKLNARHLQK